MPSHGVAVSRPLHPSHSRITDATERTHYWKVMNDMWRGRDTRAGFPACNPKSVSWHNRGALRERRYDICLKSDGVRYALVLTTRRENRECPVALMIDRSGNTYEVEVVAPEEYFVRGTIVEGELVWRQPDEEVMLFYVFDAICVKGERTTSLPFRERVRRVHSIVRHPIDAQDPTEIEDFALETDSIVMVHFVPRIVMRAKHFVAIEHAARLWRDRGDSEHRVDGIIFQDVDAPYCCGTAWDQSCLKWKDHSSIDLRGVATNLQAVDGPLPDTLFGRPVVVDESRVVGDERTVLEYNVTVTEDAVRLMATRSRPDKDSANSLHVIRETITDVIHHMRPDEFTSE